MGFRQNDNLWRAVKSVSEEIFENPLVWWKYTNPILAFLVNKIFRTDWSKNLWNRAGRERVKNLILAISVRTARQKNLRSQIRDSFEGIFRP